MKKQPTIPTMLIPTMLRVGLTCMLLTSPGTTGRQLHAQDSSPGKISQLIKWELKPTGSKSSFRAISAVSERSLWISGSAATVLRTEDGGATWIDCGPSDLGSLEFRSLHAWSDARACIASAGTPAIILLTDDGGLTWQEVYRAASEAAFFDCLRFWDAERGMAFSDPVDGRLLIVETEDAGRTWKAIPADRLPEARPAEGGFAASNSAMFLGAGGAVWIGTGGAESDSSRIYHRSNWDAVWQATECPLVSGLSRGVFSICRSGSRMVAVGGDYRLGADSGLTAACSDDGLTWRPADVPPTSFRSAVVPLPVVTAPVKEYWIASGPMESDLSLDGRVWEAGSAPGFHALAVSKGMIFAVGSDGRFAVGKVTSPP